MSKIARTIMIYYTDLAIGYTEHGRMFQHPPFVLSGSQVRVNCCSVVFCGWNIKKVCSVELYS